MEYGLIGERLGHSYSKIIHEMLCDYTYDLCPLAPDQVEDFMRRHDWKAINVTIPYKRTVMPYLDSIDEQAAAIGAVNTVVNKNGRLEGHNTDFGGFLYMVKAHGVSLAGKNVLVLGTGGTHKPVIAVCRAEGAARVLSVSRRPGPDVITYEECQKHPEIDIIVNTTPVGMYPGNGQCLIEMDWFPRCQAVFDAIYNPFATELLLRARDAGVLAVNGFEMLVAQAVYAAGWFLDKTIPESEIQRVHSQLVGQLSNLTLIGMPSSGKTSLGKALSGRLGKTFVDLDAEVVKLAGMPIPEIFAQQGEEGFRLLESQVCRKFGAQNSQVLSTGGGVVKNAANIRALRQNGPVIFIDRPLDELEVGGGRPLSTSRQALEEMEATRRPLYEAAADCIVQNRGPFDRVARAIEEAFYETACHQRP